MFLLTNVLLAFVVESQASLFCVKWLFGIKLFFRFFFVGSIDLFLELLLTHPEDQEYSLRGK